MFRVRNIPAALYKALGGFATNGVNMTKLESYMLDGEFTATQFLADVDGHREDAERVVRRMAEEGMKMRGWEIRELKSLAVDMQVEKIGCVFAAVVLWHHGA